MIGPVEGGAGVGAGTGAGVGLGVVAPVVPPVVSEGVPVPGVPELAGGVVLFAFNEAAF